MSEDVEGLKFVGGIVDPDLQVPQEGGRERAILSILREIYKKEMIVRYTESKLKGSVYIHHSFSDWLEGDLKFWNPAIDDGI